MSIKIVTAPTVEPVTLAEAKLQCRVDGTADDSLIMSYILTSRMNCEHFSNHKFITQTWDLWLDGFPGGAVLELPRSLSPLLSVTHVKYYDAEDSASTFSSDNYVADSYQEPGRIILKSGVAWPADELRVVNGVEVQVVVGYGDDAEVPPNYKQAMLLLIGHWYESREAVIIGTISAELPMGVNSLLWLNRNVPI